VGQVDAELLDEELLGESRVTNLRAFEAIVIVSHPLPQRFIFKKHSDVPQSI
jgi:hypothetical protein